MRETIAACRARSWSRSACSLGALVAHPGEGGLLAGALGVRVGLDLGLERGEPLHHRVVIIGRHAEDYGMIRPDVAAIGSPRPRDSPEPRRPRRPRRRLRRRSAGKSSASGGKEPQTAREKQLQEAKASGEVDETGQTSWGKWRYTGDRGNCFYVAGKKCFKTEVTACQALRCKAGQKCKSSGAGPATVVCGRARPGAS